MVFNVFNQNNRSGTSSSPTSYDVYVEFPPVGINAIEGDFNSSGWGITSGLIPTGLRPVYVGTATSGTTELCDGQGFLTLYNATGFFSVTNATLNYVNLLSRTDYEMEIANPTGTMTVTIPLGT